MVKCLYVQSKRESGGVEDRFYGVHPCPELSGWKGEGGKWAGMLGTREIETQLDSCVSGISPPIRALPLPPLQKLSLQS